MTQPNGQTNDATQTQALERLDRDRHVAYRENIGQDATPRAIVPRTFAEAQSFAGALASSALVPDALRNRAADVLMIVLAGAELEFPPVRSLSLFHVMDGVPKLSADGLAARVRSSPLCEYFEFVEEADTHVTWEGKRVGRPPRRITYKLADAERANLIRKTSRGEPNNWMKFPKDMMHARCKARLAKLVWPDIAAGIMTAEEAADAADGPTTGTQFVDVAAPLVPPTTPASSSPPANTSTAPASNANTSPAPTPTRSRSSKAKQAPPVIDAHSTESTSSTSTNSPPPSDRSSSSEAARESNGSADTSTASTSASSTPSAASSTESDIAQDATDSSSPADTSGSPVTVEDESGFGGDDEPAAPAARTIERFEAELAKLVESKNAGGLGAIKTDWLPWSKDESPSGGKQHAQRMRAAFAKAQAALGIK